MQMSTDYGFVFLCMPKCASTSIEKAIDKFCNINFSGHPKIKHINAQTFSESILPLHQKLLPSSNIESFCLMRDPLKWIESWYRYRSRKELKNPKHPNHKNYTGNISYNEFIQEYITKGERRPFASLGTQYNFLILDNGEIGIDNVFTMDRIDLAAKFLSEKIGKRINFSWKNISPQMSISLDRDIEQKLREYFSKNITVYDFLISHGKFNKTHHSDKLSASLQACQ